MRQWATKTWKEYVMKGFILDEPDVYMHPDLQGKLIRLVKEVSEIIFCVWALQFSPWENVWEGTANDILFS